MLIARLSSGAISSLCADFLAAWITNRNLLVKKPLAGLLVVILPPCSHCENAFHLGIT
jgi:hypothetical protein